MFRNLVLGGLVALVSAVTALSQTLPPGGGTTAITPGVGVIIPGPVPFSDDDIPRDNVEGNYVMQELEHYDPIVVKGNIMITLNRPSGQIVAFTLQPFQRFFSSPVGLGPNSVYEHPFRPWEFWITDTISNCINVWSPFTLSITHTIQTEGAPQALVFSSNGTRAYVTCSTGRSVDIIDTTTYQRVGSQPIIARDPRGLAQVAGKIFVTPQSSGNNTTAVGSLTATEIAYLPDFASLGIIPLPDNDLLAFQPSGTTLTPLTAEWVKALGTTQFNVHNRPGTTELWISNTEALNLIRGEPSFAGGKVISNRLSVVDTLGTTAPNIIDLDAIAVGSGVSQPRGLAFDGPRNRVYIACEGSDVVAAITPSGAWEGFWKLPTINGMRAMPQALELAEAGNSLIVFNYGTNTVSKIDLVNDAFGSTISQNVSLGFDPAPLSVRRGRGILNDADRSEGGTSSCASCHIGGHTNQTIYNLGNHLHSPTTPPNQVDLWIDNKGPMVTQSLRGLPEGGPYHWRGERSDLEAFNVAFEGLLKGIQLTTAELADMVAYIGALHYPANPAQNLDRSSTPNQLEGARIFLQELATGNNSCDACHTLPIGGNGEIFQETLNGQSLSFVVTQLRGIKEKEVGKHDLGMAGTFSAGFASEIGPAFLHTGRISTLFDFSESFGNIDATEATRLDDFMTAMDTGLARSTAHMATVSAQNWATFSDHLTLITAANEGHSDVVAIGSVDLGAGGIIQTSYTYNPGNGLFFPNHPSWPQLPGSVIVDLARLGYGSWTFIGTPSGMGFRKGLDLDGDALTDMLEADHGTDPENPDTDGDGFPDGYEVSHGMNPLSAVPENPNDTTAPVITSVEIIWSNTNTIKYRVRTNEPCRVTATWNGLRGAETNVSPTFGPIEIKHTFVVNFLPAGMTTSVSFVATDPASNSSPATVRSDATDDLQSPDKIFVQSVGLSTGPIAVSTGMPPTAMTSLTMTAQVMSTIGSASAVNATVTGFLYFDDGVNGIQIIDTGLIATTNASGLATFNHNLTWTLAGGFTNRHVYFGVEKVESNPLILAGYTEAFDVQNLAELVF